MARQIPVYLFVGQLESGKTKFIQETMEDPQFDSGDKTLLLVCEEGEEEYDPDRFAFGGVHVAQLEDKSELTKENLEALEKKSGCGRVIIEYNGMWLIQDLYDAMPDNWLVYQCLATADGTTIKTYAGDNAMRSLLLDKLRGSELLVVNRAEHVNDDESRQLIHKLVRQASRRCDIAYEFADGSVAYDDIPDPAALRCERAGHRDPRGILRHLVYGLHGRRQEVRRQDREVPRPRSARPTGRARAALCPAASP